MLKWPPLTKTTINPAVRGMETTETARKARDTRRASARHDGATAATRTTAILAARSCRAQAVCRGRWVRRDPSRQTTPAAGTVHISARV